MEKLIVMQMEAEIWKGVGYIQMTKQRIVNWYKGNLQTF